jgi:CAAX prenyl protease-like protein
MPEKRKIAAYLLPILAFVLLLVLNSALKAIGDHFLLSSAEYWIYPAQVMICGSLLVWFRSEYNFKRPRHAVFAVLIAVAVFLIWISPQQFFGSPVRVTGFNPDVFAARPSAYWMTIVLRFLRLAVVVPFVEEIFWRGFLLRFLIDENFERVPIGTFSWLSFVVVSAGFGFSHASEDWIAALFTGALYNGVAYFTKRLSSCVLTHAVTNLLLGLWIMKTKQWGFW